MSGGDGMGGLVIAIMFAAVLMVVACAAAGFFVVAILTKQRASHIQRAWLQIVGATVGALLGGLLVIATFAENMWSPPDELTLRLPLNFAHSSVYLIEDRSAVATLHWQGTNAIPFMQRTSTFEVPASGVIRVVSLGMGETIRLPRTRFSNGEESTGSFSRPAPKEIGSGLMLGFSRPNSGNDFFSGDDALLVGEIRKRELR
jgi:hypothetical protein